MNRHKTGILVTLALISLQLIAVFPFKIQPAAASPQTLIVPDNYPTIMSALGNATQGDTVFVKSGVYHENIFINKSVTITGEDSKSTVIIGQGLVPNTYVFNITADNVKISGFTIESANSSSSTTALIAGGIAIGGNGCTVTGNNIKNVNRGIFAGGGWDNVVGAVSQTTITNNNITGTIAGAIRLYGGSDNLISGNNLVGNFGSAIALTGDNSVVSDNNLENNNRGIGTSATDSVFFGNSVTNSAYWGIYFESSNNIIAANYFGNNKWGVYLSPAFPPQNNTFYHNDFVNNSNQVSVGSPYSVQNWDNGYPSGGNYWSNYVGVDLKSGPSQNAPGSDGIGDSAFAIGANNTDRYPLVAQFNISQAGPSPSPIRPYQIKNNVVALWHLNTIEADMSTPDATGNNPINFSPIPYLPNVVPGKFGQAINFTFYPYGSVPASPSLDITQEITIDAWIKVTAFENTTYNNILVQSAYTFTEEPDRIWGLAVNGMSPANATSGPLGAVCGYVYTSSGYNEIVTTNSAVKPNQWTHIVFTRSLTTGMHIYVNGVEQPVMVTSGSQNPTGELKLGSELYFGADYSGYIDEVRISNVAENPQVTNGVNVFGLQWWVWIIAAGIVAVIICGVTYAFEKKRKRQIQTSL